MMTAEQAGCAHQTFGCVVGVHRLTSEEGGEVTGYSADISIYCDVCKLPFRFIGLPQGVSPFQPMTSPDDLEMRAPIQPGPGEMSTVQKFVMPKGEK